MHAAALCTVYCKILSRDMGYQLENHMRCVGANNFMIDNWQQTRFWNIRFNLNLHLPTLIFSNTFSESLRGCYPNDKSLPGLSGSLIPQKPNCVFLPKRRSPVKVIILKVSVFEISNWTQTGSLLIFLYELQTN